VLLGSSHVWSAAQIRILRTVNSACPQWRNNFPAATQGAGGPRGSGDLVPTPTPTPPVIFFHDSCRVRIVVIMDAAQFTSNCLIAGRGPYDHVLQPLQGEAKFVVTPLHVHSYRNVWLTCTHNHKTCCIWWPNKQISLMPKLQENPRHHWMVSITDNIGTAFNFCMNMFSSVTDRLFSYKAE